MSLLPQYPQSHNSTALDSQDIPDGTPVWGDWALYDNEQDSLVVYPKQGPLDYQSCLFTGDGTATGSENSWYTAFHDTWTRSLYKLPTDLGDETLRAWRNVVHQAHKVCESGNVPYHVWPTASTTHADEEGRSVLTIAFKMNPQVEYDGAESENGPSLHEGS